MAHTEVDFTYQEAVRTLGVTPEKLDHLIDDGKISVITTSSQMLIPRESILRYLATVTSVGKEKKKAAAPAKEAPAAKAAAPKAEAPKKAAPAEAAATTETPVAAATETPAATPSGEAATATAAEMAPAEAAPPAAPEAESAPE